MNRSIGTVFFACLFFACAMLGVGIVWAGAAIARVFSCAFEKLLQFGDRVMRLFISEEELP